MSSLTELAGKNAVSIRPQIGAALARASKATGVDFEYLVDTALRESNLKTSAKSKTSSATGLFQFIDQTWLSTVKEFGSKFGLQRYSDAIERTPSGRHIVSSPALKREILALRTDPEISAMMAASYAGKSAAYLKEVLGREPRQGEVYIAHFLGLKGGAELVSAAAQKPEVSAAALFPAAARSNRSIFYNKRGQARTVAQVYNTLVSKHSSEIAGYNAQRPQLVRVPGQPLRLNDGLLKNLGRSLPVENALIANAQYTRSIIQNRAISTRPTPVQPSSSDVYRPTSWPIKPAQGQGQKVQYPAAGPGSLGYESVQATAAASLSANGSLVSSNKRPFAAFSKVAQVLKAQVQQTQRQVSSKPTVLAAGSETVSRNEAGAANRVTPAASKKLGQIFVDAGGSFFTMRGRK
jgi:hypothetical protein